MKILQIVVTVGLISTLLSLPVFAQPTESSNYRLNEAFIGPGGTVDSNSSGYGLRGSLGDLGVGESSSPGYNLLAGYTTDAEPTLLFQVNVSTIDLGILSAGATQTGNATFSVGSYNADGYVVQTVSPPPSYEANAIDPITSAAPSAAGTEQFGINLVANTTPVSFGASPVQIPDGSFSSGYAASGYNTVNQYQYNEGDVVARSDQSSGVTDFTLSYIANITPTTPSGEYRMNQFLVATSTF